MDELPTLPPRGRGAARLRLAVIGGLLVSTVVVGFLFVSTLRDLYKRAEVFQYDILWYAYQTHLEYQKLTDLLLAAQTPGSHVDLDRISTAADIFFSRNPSMVTVLGPEIGDDNPTLRLVVSRIDELITETDRLLARTDLDIATVARALSEKTEQLSPLLQDLLSDVRQRSAQHWQNEKLAMLHSLLSVVVAAVVLITCLLAFGALSTIQMRRLEVQGQELTELSHGLKIAKEAAERANSTKSAFLATMSHEIRTPLNSVIGMADLLVDTPLNESQLRYIRVINASAQHLLSIIGDILDFSRIEAGKLDIECIPFDLRTLCDDVTEIARALPNGSILEIRQHIDEDVPSALLGDPGRLTQVLLNIVGNAVKFTEAGSVSLSISIARREGKHISLMFSVVDTGKGIPAELHDRLFEPFEQADSDVGRLKSGTGLGLAISKRLVQVMGGAIGFESGAGQGSTFWFQIPFEVGRVSMPAAGRRADVVAPTNVHLRVLVAEDTPANQLVIRSMLESMGHRVQTVSNGAEAIDAVQQAKFDLVLMDLQMPIMGGYEATRRIRALPGDVGRIPIVALTALALSTDRERAQASGMNEFLTKPIRKADLTGLIDRLLGRVHAPVSQPTEELEFDGERLTELLDSVGLQQFERILDTFAADVRFDLVEIERAIAAADYPALRIRAHRLKGIFYQIGACNAGKLAGMIETAEGAEALVLGRSLLSYGPSAIDESLRHGESLIVSQGFRAEAEGRAAG
ncbi:hypothetical protein STAQ_08370 [Allostella sp. ATCC 35155]|nr:hypothetical protein STAQ_08370 [Stella sp. ATCC 35155]